MAAIQTRQLQPPPRSSLRPPRKKESNPYPPTKEKTPPAVPVNESSRQVVRDPTHQESDRFEVSEVLSKLLFPSPGHTRIRFMQLENPEKTKEVEKELQSFLRWCSDAHNNRDQKGVETHFVDKAEGPLDVCNLLRGRSRVDPRSFLVTNRGAKVPLEELKNKYVVIACFSVPLLSGSSESNPCHALIHLSEELSARNVKDCKFVLIIKGRPNFGGAEKWFKDFFEAFPYDFLAIPFEDVDCRQSVSQFLSKSNMPFMAGLILDPAGNILDKSLHNVVNYRADYYPFSEVHLSKINSQDKLLEARLDTFAYCPTWHSNDPLGVFSLPPLSLAELLQCKPQDCPLVSIGGPHDPMVPTPVCDLDGKLVVLYMFSNGKLMPTLQQLQEQCKGLNPKFEVVVVPLAFWDSFTSCLNHLKLALSHLQIKSWFALYPYNDKVTRTLWRICGKGLGDNFIVFPIGDEYSGEIQAQEVLSFIRPTEESTSLPPSIYPFTKEELYRDRISEISWVTPLKLLGRSKYVRCCNGGPSIPLEEAIQDKNVIIYYNCLAAPDFGEHLRTAQMIIPRYEKVHGDCVVVCVFSFGLPPIKSKRGGKQARIMRQKFAKQTGIIKKLSWMMLHPHEEAARSLPKDLFTEHLGEEKPEAFIAAFQKDGSLVSRKVFSGIPCVSGYNLDDEIYQGVLADINGWPPYL